MPPTSSPYLDAVSGRTPAHMPVWFMRQAGRGLRALALGVALGLSMVACDGTSDVVTAPSPCPDGHVVDLGAPTLGTGRLAGFDLVRGPVWLGVDQWSVLPLEVEPFSAPFQFGPRDQPPGPDERGSIESRTAQVSVNSEGWTRLDIAPGSYWVGTDGRVRNAQLRICGEGEVRDIAPAN